MNKVVENVLCALDCKVTELLKGMEMSDTENLSVVASLVCKYAKGFVERKKGCSDFIIGVYAKFIEGLIEQDSFNDCLDYFECFDTNDNSFEEFSGLWLYFRFVEVRKIVDDFARYLSEKKPHLEFLYIIIPNLIGVVRAAIEYEDCFCGDLKEALFDRFVDEIMGYRNYDYMDEIEIEGFDTDGYSEWQRECVEFLLRSNAMVTIFEKVPKYRKILIACWEETFEQARIRYDYKCE